MYASSWFLTLYTTALNLNLICCRIMDVFLSEGMEMIFKIALALLTIGKETVLSLDMEAMLKVSLCSLLALSSTASIAITKISMRF
jgi:ecotropic viral integration site 5 protein